MKTFQYSECKNYKRQELLIFRKHMGSPPVFGGVCVAHLFSLLCCVAFLCFAYFNPVSCVPNVASISGLSILDCTFGFL
jgi:hypothetical protein